MEPFLYYLLRASVLMALFYGFHKLFFGKNTFHRINRFLLISIVMLVALLPVFRFNLIPEKKAEPVVPENFPVDFSNIPIVEISELPAKPIQIPRIEILSVFFAVGLLFALVRYLIGLNQLTGIIRTSEKQTLADETVLCITDKDISPFSWMKYIVLSRKDVTADNRAIINHERAHIHLQHSLDMILFDLFTCVFWFNPFSWLLRREIQSVHEYQADEQVLNNGIEAKQYQLLLIRKSVGEYKFALANNFRQRDLHKRITMMMKTKSNKRMKWNYTAVLPVLFLAMVALSVPKLNASIPEKTPDDFPETIILEGDSIMLSKGVVYLAQNPLDLGKVKIIAKEDLIKISGQVIDETGNPIKGVKLIKEGENKAILSDMDGNFTLDTERGTSVSFVISGYKTQKVTFNKPESNFKISLEKGEGENAELITMRIKGRNDADEAIESQSKLTVSGFVKSKDGFIPGVAVIIKGSKTGIITDPEGKFVIKAEKGDVLRFVMMGYKIFEYKVENAESNAVIVLQSENTEVDTKENVGLNTGNAQPARPVLRGIDMLKGKPLYILDGKPIDSLDNVNPDNIESISILKNKSASAIYGERGKDGVVLITTKKPEKYAIHFEPDKEPLIVIDGVKMSKDFELSSVRPEEIESMSVLKDKSALEIYGEDAKNGVIIITKKSNN